MIKIANYTIRPIGSDTGENRRQYEVWKTTILAVKSKMIADKMNQNEPAIGIGQPDKWNIGDTYEKDVRLGYYPKLENACEKILDDMVHEEVEGTERDDVYCLMSFIESRKWELKEAILADRAIND